MRISIEGQNITIMTSDGKSFTLQEGHINELENALKIIKLLNEYDTLEKISYASAGISKPIELKV